MYTRFIKIIATLFAIAYNVYLLILGRWGWGLMFLFVTALFIVVVFRGKGKSFNSIRKKFDLDVNINADSIPSSCPSCKNPNSQKLLVCEWCGNPIV